MDTNRRFFTPGWDSNAHMLDTLDLLQKSVEFNVVNRGGQVEAQRKSRSPNPLWRIALLIFSL
jgi:hypothetical protein